MLEPYAEDGVQDRAHIAHFPERFRLSRQRGEADTFPAALFLGLNRGLGRSRSEASASTDSMLMDTGKVKSVPKPLAKLLPKQLLQVDALSPVSIQVIFSRPLVEEELDPDTAKTSFKLGGGLELAGRPWLKGGTKSCYIVPTELQQPGKRYTLSYRGGDKLGFKAGVDRLFFRQIRQISYDTVELLALLSDGVADYRLACIDEPGSALESRRSEGGESLQLNTDNVCEGRHYQIIPPLESRTIWLTPEGGTPVAAQYIPMTQYDGSRQAPQFRLPDRYAFTPGQIYTASMEWGRIGMDGFSGSPWIPCLVQDITKVSDERLQVRLAGVLDCDPFAGRRLLLTGKQGERLQAAYVAGSCSGMTGEFRLEPECRLQAGVAYTVTSLGPWASLPAGGMPLQVSNSTITQASDSFLRPRLRINGVSG